MNILVRALVLLILFVFPLLANAEQDARLLGELSRQKNSPTAVMRSARCHITWLSQVMQDSGITVSQLRKLSVGQKILLNESYNCKAVAPKEIAKASAEAIRLDAQLAQRTEATRKVRQALTQVAKLKEDLAAVNKAGESLQGKLRESDDALKLLEAKVKSQTNQAGASKKGLIYDMFAVGLPMLFLGLLIGVFSTRWFLLRKSSEPETTASGLNPEVLPIAQVQVVPLITETSDNKTINVGDVNYTFFAMTKKRDQEADPWTTYFKCPVCTENKLKEPNFRSHLAKVHGVKEISLKEVEIPSSVKVVSYDDDPWGFEDLPIHVVDTKASSQNVA